jgi:predicted N-formylglutamate amidohydrolase
VLYNKDKRFAAELLRQLGSESGLMIGDNEPYAVSDTKDYTIPVHGERRGIPHVGIEIRQDLIVTAAGQSEWAQRLARALVAIAGRNHAWCQFDATS